MIGRLILVLISTVWLLQAKAQQRMFIIPKPAELIEKPGSFSFSPTTLIYYSPGLKDIAEIAALVFKVPGSNLRLIGKGQKPVKGSVTILMSGPGDRSSYRLVIDPSQARITAAGYAGCLYGVQTLSQLILTASGNAVPCGVISDVPRFGVSWTHA